MDAKEYERSNARGFGSRVHAAIPSVHAHLEYTTFCLFRPRVTTHNTIRAALTRYIETKARSRMSDKTDHFLWYGTHYPPQHRRSTQPQMNRVPMRALPKSNCSLCPNQTSTTFPQSAQPTLIAFRIQYELRNAVRGPLALNLSTSTYERSSCPKPYLNRISGPRPETRSHAPTKTNA